MRWVHAVGLALLLGGCDDAGPHEKDPRDSGSPTEHSGAGDSSGDSDSAGDSGRPDDTDTTLPTDADHDGYDSDVDCDDGDAAVHPNAAEVCNGVDDDCDGAVNEGAIAFEDLDGDGHGGGWIDASACASYTGATVPVAGDCDDLASDVYPGAAEPCDGIDNDCDGQTDEDDLWVDEDGDGFGGARRDGACDASATYAPDGDDCADDDASAAPGTVEVCDGVDNDCDGQTDEGFEYADRDGDGVGDAARDGACDAAVSYVAEGGDCDDADASLGPLSCETCDGIDNDCDGSVDNTGAGAGCGEPIYIDEDGDGYGGRGLGDGCACWIETYGLPRATAEGGDCDDEDEGISPGVGEACHDGVDNDCDGLVDCEDDDCPEDQCAETDCADGRDNDDDGWEDCDDDDCWSAGCALTAARVTGGTLHVRSRVASSATTGTDIQMTTMEVSGTASGTVRAHSGLGATVEICTWIAAGISVRGHKRIEQHTYRDGHSSWLTWSSSRTTLPTSGGGVAACTSSTSVDLGVMGSSGMGGGRSTFEEAFVDHLSRGAVTLNADCDLSGSEFLPTGLDFGDRRRVDTPDGDRWYSGRFSPVYSYAGRAPDELFGGWGWQVIRSSDVILEPQATWVAPQ